MHYKIVFYFLSFFTLIIFTGACEDTEWAGVKCICDENGELNCPEPIEEIKEGEGYCIPNSIFKHPDGCNRCMCSRSGRLAGCTKMACYLCKDTYWAGVTCTCNEKNELICPQPIEEITPGEENYCVPYSQFTPDGCNTCKCSFDSKTATCTLMACKE